MNNQNKSDKLTMIIHAGLGNQFFMIFTLISKAIDENRDFSIYPIFNNGPRKYYFSNLFKKLLFKIENNIENIQSRPSFEEMTQYYTPIPREACVLKGYFQSPKYFDHNKDKIIKMLELDKYFNKYKFEEDVVLVHFRFEDYQINQIDHVLLSPLYYINAISRLIEMIPDAVDKYKFVIFAQEDDNDLVDDYIDDINSNIYDKFNKKINFVKSYELFPDGKDFKEIIYMSSCKHFIIANSSFSWFGAYLSRNTDAKVFYPDEWFGPRIKNSKPIHDMFTFDNWIKIKAS